MKMVRWRLVYFGMSERQIVLKHLVKLKMSFSHFAQIQSTIVVKS